MSPTESPNATKLEIVTESEVQAPTLTKAISKATLEGTPDRAKTFLKAAAKRELRKILMAAGYTEEDHREGMRLVTEILGYRLKQESLETDPEDAYRELEAWDNGILKIVRGALQRLHPEQAKHLFGGLPEIKGKHACAGLTVLLERITELESDPQRQDTRTADHAALATMAKRGFDKKEREKLEALVHVATTLPTVEIPEEEVARHQRNLELLRAWYEDWSNTARVRVKSRQDRIRLGIAQARAPREEETAPPATQPTQPPIPQRLVTASSAQNTPNVSAPPSYRNGSNGAPVS